MLDVEKCGQGRWDLYWQILLPLTDVSFQIVGFVIFTLRCAWLAAAFVATLVAQSAFLIYSGRPSPMYMYSLHDIGRESWVWEEQEAL